jgi:hypothetical protein
MSLMTDFPAPVTLAALLAVTVQGLVSGHRIAMRQRVGPVPGKRPPLRPGYVAGTVLEPEPVLVTDPTLTEVLDELRAREPLFHHPQFGTTRSHLEAMTTEDSWQVGASWRGYGRVHVLDILVPADR